MKKIKSITAIGTGKLNKGDVFTAKPSDNGEYKLFKSGKNTLDHSTYVNSLDDAIELMGKGFNILLHSDTSTAQRCLKSCTVEYYCATNIICPKCQKTSYSQGDIVHNPQAPHYDQPFYECFNINAETSKMVFAEDLGLTVKEPFMIVPKEQL